MSHEEPWQKTCHLIIKLDGVSDAPTFGLGVGVKIVAKLYQGGGGSQRLGAEAHQYKKYIFPLFNFFRPFSVCFPMGV